MRVVLNTTLTSEFGYRGFLTSHTVLFPLNCCGGLFADVVDDAVDAVDFRHDAVSHRFENFVREVSPSCRHEVDRIDRTNGDGVFVRAFAVFDAHGFDGQENGKRL